MAVSPAIAPLACGRDAATEWDRAAAGIALDVHERACPHCGAVLADARGLASVVHRMAVQALEPPPSVLDRVLGAAESGPGPPEVLGLHEVLMLPSPYGPAQLRTTAAAAVLRHVVDQMGGVRARSCRIEQSGAVGEPPVATVTLTVAARFGVDLTSVSVRVRQMVVAAADQVLGVPVLRVDIEVVDVFEDGAR